MYVHVKVTASARKERVTKVDETEFHIEVKEPAERNMANKRVQEVLAIEFGVPTTAQVRILTGHRSPSKMYTIEGTDGKI